MIKIDFTSFIPIYEQIKMQFKGHIAARILKSHDPLPSIRELATELLINPNTVARAYRELEREGYLTTRKGKGCYVSDNTKASVHKERTALLNKICDDVIQEAKKYQLTPSELKSLFNQRLTLSLKDKED
jgi:GntR family transcriptional regulator